MRPVLISLALLTACGATVRELRAPWPAQPLSMGDAYMSCRAEPDGYQDWFPRHHLKSPFLERELGDGGVVEERMAPERCFAGVVLRSYQEPVLLGTPGETYRVIWTPSFRPPVVIRIHAEDGRYTAVVKKDLAVAEEVTGAFSTTVTELTAAEFGAARAAVERAGCWDADHTCHAEKSLDPTRVYADGAGWLIEGARGDAHWAVRHDNPEPGPFTEACDAVVRAAHAEGQLRER